MGWSKRCAASLVLSVFQLFPADVRADVPSIDDAIAAARAAEKALVVEFHADWCEPCRLFAHDILPTAEVRAALERVIFVRYDLERGAGVEAAERFGVVDVPTFLVIDHTGQVRAHQGGLGGSDTAWFVRFLEGAESLAVDDAQIARILVESPDDPRELLRAARWYRSRGDHTRAIECWPTFEE